MFDNETCVQCGEIVKLSVQPVERRRHLSLDELICPNGHYRELTYNEIRLLE